ncbi:hypothetical protein AMTR_s00084p00178010 [Amborella trichopoda]|uniref:Uncharacterized protein n=1 Tax=Amborella trichopoda TaxID=13333 RepID=W1P414_AMBTC|nr:hypothetical protein AMTR_s00084p00178010 [Amborella trichopoda]
MKAPLLFRGKGSELLTHPSHITATCDEALGFFRDEEPIPFDQSEEIVPDNRDEDVGDEGLNIFEQEGPNERSEQPVAVAPDDMDGGVRDEGPSISQGEEAGTDGRLEQPEASVLGLSRVEARSGLEKSGNLGFEVAPLECHECSVKWSLIMRSIVTWSIAVWSITMWSLAVRSIVVWSITVWSIIV